MGASATKSFDRLRIFKYRLPKIKGEKTLKRGGIHYSTPQPKGHLFVFFCYVSWFLHQMVAHFTMRTCGVNQEFRFVKGNLVSFSRKRPILHHTCAAWSELPFYLNTLDWILLLDLTCSYPLSVHIMVHILDSNSDLVAHV